MEVNGIPVFSNYGFSKLQTTDRKVSTGTLNRLILVAQALESEVETRRNDDISAIKITFSIRVANTVSQWCDVISAGNYEGLVIIGELVFEMKLIWIDFVTGNWEKQKEKNKKGCWGSRETT